MAIKEIDQLKNLSFNKQIVFGYLTCERVFPMYVYFVEHYHFGNIKIVRQAIDFIYQSIFDTDNINRETIEYFLTMIHNNIPHMDDFATFYASLALDSGVVMFESMNLLKRNNTGKILEDISTSPTDAIDCYIQVRDDMDYNDTNFETKILNDTLMQREINLQKGIIAYLDKIDEVDVADVETLIQLQENNKCILPF